MTYYNEKAQRWEHGNEPEKKEPVKRAPRKAAAKKAAPKAVEDK